MNRVPKIIWLAVYASWFIFSFLAAMSQSHYATILFNKDGELDFKALLEEKTFLFFLAIWVIGSLIITFSPNSPKAEPDEDVVIRKWIKSKAKMVDDIRKKAKNGNYDGAEETIKILKKLDDILREDKK